MNILLTPADGVVTDITNEAAQLVDPSVNLDLVANLWFGIGSTLFLTVVISLVTTQIVEPRLARGTAAQADEEELAREEGPPIDAAAEAKGLRWALYALLGVLAVVLAADAAAGRAAAQPRDRRHHRRLAVDEQPDRDHLGAFLAAGLAFGRAAGTVKGSEDALGMITKSWASLASLLFLFLLIAQFIAYFDFSNIAQVVAISLGDLLEDLDLGNVCCCSGSSS